MDNRTTLSDEDGIVPRIGEIYMMRFDGVGNEQSGWRPGLVFQNNTGNLFSPNIIALPLTSSLKKSKQPTHVVIPASDGGLLRDSMVLCENPERMSKARIGDYITTVSNKQMGEIAAAHLIATGAISFIDQNALSALWRKASLLNDRI